VFEFQWQEETWPDLKKGRPSGPHDRLHRRSGLLSAAVAHPDLRAAGGNTGIARPVGMGSPVGDRRDYARRPGVSSGV
jgi:hypothetical protein